MRRRYQFIDLAISSHSSTKMLCLRLKCFNSTITKTRSCVVGLASNMRLKGITCSSRSVRFLYTEHHKSRHTFHTTSVIPSKLILDLSRDLFRVCFPVQKEEEKIEATSKNNDNDLKSIILSTMEMHYQKLSKRLESVESRCGRMESMLELLLGKNKK